MKTIKVYLLKMAFILQALILNAQAPFLKDYGDFSGKGNSLIINSRNNFVISVTINEQFSLYEINDEGTVLWHKEYENYGKAMSSQIIESKEGGYTIVGLTFERSSRLIKTNSEGEVIWTKKIGEDVGAIGMSITQNNLGEYFIGSRIIYNTNGLSDFALIKTDINGNVIWIRNYGDKGLDELKSMAATADGGFILCGYSDSFSPFSDNPQDVYLVKTGSLGLVEWTSHIEGVLDEIPKSVKQTSDGGYIITGYTQSLGYKVEDMFVIKTTSKGKTQWIKTYEHEERISAGNDVIESIDGGYIVTGYIKRSVGLGGSVAYLAKIDAIGNVLWEQELLSITNPTFTLIATSIQQTRDGGYAITGYVLCNNQCGEQLLLAKTNNYGAVGLEDNQSIATINSFPNPFTTSTTIDFKNLQNESFTFRLFDNHGRLVRIQENIKTNRIELERENLSAGIYFIQLSVDKEIRSTGKLIIK